MRSSPSRRRRARRRGQRQAAEARVHRPRGHDASGRISVERGRDTAQATPYGPGIPALGDWQMNVIGVARRSPPGMLAVGGLPSNRVLDPLQVPGVAGGLEHHGGARQSRAAPGAVHRVPGGQRLAVHAAAGDASRRRRDGSLEDRDPPARQYGRRQILGDSDQAREAAAGARRGSTRSRSSARERTSSTSGGASGAAIQRAIVLTIVGEGAEPRELLFYGPTAAPALRPRVHVSYVPHSAIGLP